MLFKNDEDSLKKLEAFANDETNPVTYLAIDPGNSNGVCGYGDDFKLVMMWTIDEKDILVFLGRFKNIKNCIIENYRLYTNKAFQQAHSDMLTSRVIGRVESWAQLNSIILIKQGANVKPIGYKFLGKKPLPKSNPLNHAMDAHAHFIYWGVSKGKINAKELIANATPENLRV